MAKKKKVTLGDKRTFAKEMYLNWQLYLMVLIPVAYIVIFAYWPMYGAQIAFRDFQAVDGIWGSEWVGLKHFKRFMADPKFLTILVNTIRISVYGLIAGFPMPIMLALALHICGTQWFKKTVQMVTYAPHFISTVVMVGMLNQFLDTKIGFVNRIIVALGGEAYQFLQQAAAFDHVYVWSGIWQGCGFSCIIYLAALSSIDPELHEAALIDGASRIQRVWYIDLPGIVPTIVMLLILNCGSIMSVGFEKIYLMQNDLNTRKSEVISTYVYKIGIKSSGLPQYSYSSAIGLFNSIINFILLIVVNQISKSLTHSSLF